LPGNSIYSRLASEKREKKKKENRGGPVRILFFYFLFPFLFSLLHGKKEVRDFKKREKKKEKNVR